MTVPLRVLAFTKYDRAAASARQRLLQYLPALAEAGIQVDYRPLLGDDYIGSLAGAGQASRAAIARSYARRLREVSRPGGVDVLWVYAELFPYLPAPFERLAFRSGKPVVYDFDDAFFHQYDHARRPAVRRLLAGKLDPLMTGAAVCTCGNPYLQEHALRRNPNSILLPTVVDTDRYRPASARNLARPITIGWIGSPSTWPYMRPLLPMLQELTRSAGVRVKVVGSGRAADNDLFEGMDVVPWSEEREVAEVQAMDIGIMPLPDEPWARGKSGYKLIQYMACGLPVVASPVGVNRDIVVEGGTGFFANTPGAWRLALSRLLADPKPRERMGAAGRERAISLYSLRAHASTFVQALRQAAATGGLDHRKGLAGGR